MLVLAKELVIVANTCIIIAFDFTAMSNRLERHAVSCLFSLRHIFQSKSSFPQDGRHMDLLC